MLERASIYLKIGQGEPRLTKIYLQCLHRICHGNSSFLLWVKSSNTNISNSNHFVPNMHQHLCSKETTGNFHLQQEALRVVSASIVWPAVWTWNYHSWNSHTPNAHYEMLSFLKTEGVPVVAQWVKSLTSTSEDVGSIPGLTQLRCCKLWRRSQAQLGSGVTVAVA